MSKVIHVGVFTDDLDPARLPNGVTSDGDSFLEWGEPRRVGDPVHLIVDLGVLGVDEITRSFVEEGYTYLDSRLRDGERLVDYAVVTDSVDWAVNQQTILLLGPNIGPVDPRTVQDPPPSEMDFGDYDQWVEEPEPARRWSPYGR